jgi:uncharacterized membrane protein YdbT with pleckstrin-like domain
MLYVKQSLAPGEDLIHVARFHWFYDVQAILNIAWGLFFAISILAVAVTAEQYLPSSVAKLFVTSDLQEGDSWLTIVRKLHPGIKLFSLLIFIIGVFRCVQMLVIKATTEIAVTTSRLIFKRGLVARYVGEMNIDRIESVSVLQSVFGRIFDFGTLVVRGMGVGELVLPQIARPLVFRKAIEKARTS